MGINRGCQQNDSLVSSMASWEHQNVAAENPGPLSALKARLLALQPTFFDPVRSGGDADKASAAAVARGNFWGPFVYP